MKKIAILIAFVALSWGCFAQDNGIIYTDFEPNWCMPVGAQWSHDSIKLDFEQDGVIDFVLEMYVGREPEIRFIPLNGTEWRIKCGVNSSTYLLDTAVSAIVANKFKSIRKDYILYESRRWLVGVRKIVADTSYCYGWFEFDWLNEANSINAFACVNSMAYCSIPNYPLRWGQTTMTSIAEDEDDSFVSLYPNPTTGVINIKGERLRQAEIFNSLGQRIVLIHSSDDEFSVDMSGLPSGLYYATITDAEGRIYTRKIVKE